MPNYLFQLGHQPHISRTEIVAVLQTQKIPYTLKNTDHQYLELSTPEKLDATKLNVILGGTVKIMEELAASKDLVNDLINYLNRLMPEGKINFSLSGPNAPKLAIAIKKNLKQLDRSVRYIEPKNTATILHNNLIKTESDISIVYNHVYITRSIQSLEEFSERDYDRPGIDSKSGMLPPKLARIMINLTGSQTNTTLLDPFCGSGTVLIEAIDLGFTNLMGSDISDKAIADTQKNVDWYIQKNNQKINLKLFTSDARAIEKRIEPWSIDAIVSEPFMGIPLRGNETKEQLTISARNLRTLYENAFKIFTKILKPNGVVVFIIPEFYTKNETVTIDCLKYIRELGFKTMALDPESDSLLYHRPGQFVGRRIWKFIK